MGLAIFWIFFYHTGIDIPGLRELFALGWMGVDIFFFVSGYGLCASLTKRSSTKSFYIRRINRIIPTWWLILAVMAIVGTIASLKGFPKSASDYFYWFTGLGWWTGNCNFEWYIPTLIIFYILAPLFSRMSKKYLAISIGITIIAAVMLGYFHLFQHVYMSYSRIPIYITGFLLYKIHAQRASIPLKKVIYISVPGAIIFLLGMYVRLSDLTWGLTIARVSIPLFIVPMLWLISLLIKKCKPLESVLSFLGLISLEIYLLHINHEFSELINNRSF